MATRRVTKLPSINARLRRRWHGRNLTNAAVPMAIQAFSGRDYFNTWFRLKLALQGRRVRK